MRKGVQNLILASCILLTGYSNLKTQGFEWAKSIDGNSWCEGEFIVVDGFGNVYTTGYFQGTADFDSGVGTFNLSATGDKDFFYKN